MFDVGMPELIVIFVIALLVFGPDKLPELARTLGKGLAELKKSFEDVKGSVEEEFKEATSDIREAVTSVKQQIETEVKDTGQTLGSTIQEVKEQVGAETEEIHKTLASAKEDIEDIKDKGEQSPEQTVKTSDDVSKEKS
jgi:Tat protein translocase TatB subunit